MLIYTFNGSSNKRLVCFDPIWKHVKASGVWYASRAYVVVQYELQYDERKSGTVAESLLNDSVTIARKCLTFQVRLVLSNRAVIVSLFSGIKLPLKTALCVNNTVTKALKLQDRKYMLFLRINQFFAVIYNFWAAHANSKTMKYRMAI